MCVRARFHKFPNLPPCDSLGAGGPDAPVDVAFSSTSAQLTLTVGGPEASVDAKFLLISKLLLTSFSLDICLSSARALLVACFLSSRVKASLSSCVKLLSVREEELNPPAASKILASSTAAVTPSV